MRHFGINILYILPIDKRRKKWYTISLQKNRPPRGKTADPLYHTPHPFVNRQNVQIFIYNFVQTAQKAEGRFLALFPQCEQYHSAIIRSLTPSNTVRIKNLFLGVGVNTRDFAYFTSPLTVLTSTEIVEVPTVHSNAVRHNFLVRLCFG